MTLRQRAESLVSSKAGSWWFLHVANPIDKVLLPLTRGRVSSAPGRQVLLLDTIGAKSGVYKPEFANFSNLRAFVDAGGHGNQERATGPQAA